MTRSLLGAVVCGVLAMSLAGCGVTTFVVGLAPGDQELTSTVVETDGSWVKDRVAMVDLSGLIFNGRKPGLLSEGDNPVSDLTEKLEEARNDERVKAVILRINSPGGTVTASDAMYREVRRFREGCNKPVVALIMDVGASGGYYVACAADKIVAYPTSITGSIGVIVQTISVKDGLSRIGIHAEAITSGPNKETGSPLTDMTDSQRQVLRGLVDDFYRQFSGIVKERRPAIPADKFAMVTDGRVVSGAQAVGLGLIDVTGDLRSTFELAKQMAGIPKAKLIVYHRPLAYIGSPYAASPVGAPGYSNGGGASAGGTQINIAQFNLADSLQWSTAGFYYLWDPGR
jgi:protease IV